MSGQQLPPPNTASQNLECSSVYPEGWRAVAFSFHDLEGTWSYDLVAQDAIAREIDLPQLVDDDHINRGKVLSRIPRDREIEAESLLIAVAQWDPNTCIRVFAIAKLAHVPTLLTAETLKGIIRVPMDKPPSTGIEGVELFCDRIEAGTKAHEIASDEVRAAAVLALESHDPEHRVSTAKLVSWLCSGDKPHMRQAAKKILLQRFIGTPSDAVLKKFGLQLLRKSFSVEDPILSDVMEVVCALAKEEAELILRETLVAANYMVGRGLRALRSLNFLLHEDPSQRLCLVNETLRSHPNADLRKLAATLGASASALIRGLEDRDVNVRNACMGALRETRTLPDSEVRLLADLFEHRNVMVRRCASGVLRHISPVDEALEPLLEALGDSDYETRNNAVHALCNLRAPAPAVSTLTGLLDSGNGNERNSAIVALGLIGENARSDALLDRLWLNVRNIKLSFPLRESSLDSFLKVGGQISVIRLREDRPILGTLHPRLLNTIDRFLGMRDNNDEFHGD